MGVGDHKHLTANSPTVVAEVIDGEAVLINFDTGSYYSLDGAGAAAWEVLAGGATPAEVVRRLEALYESDGASIREATLALIADLEKEGLIVESASGSEPAADRDPPSSKLPFERPALNKFTDMQEMLLLDPIHDVGRAGWPYPNAEQNDGATGTSGR